MIRKNSLACKLLLAKHQTAGAEYRKQLKMLVPGREQCPCCGAVGRCVPYGSYLRYVVDFVDGRPVSETIEVQRLQCESCRATHAVLIDSLVPYSSYSLFFMLRVIGIALHHEMTVEQTCQYAGICVSTYYRWVYLFEKHKDEWLGRLESKETPALRFYEDLLEEDPYRLFSRGFYELTLFSFLQSHSNPANCRYRPGS